MSETLGLTFQTEKMRSGLSQQLSEDDRLQIVKESVPCLMLKVSRSFKAMALIIFSCLFQPKL